MKWLLPACLVFVILTLQYRIWMTPEGVPGYMELQSEVETNLQEIKRLELRNVRLMAEVSDLKSQHDAVEERARTDLGMIKKGESFYFIKEGTTK